MTEPLPDARSVLIAEQEKEIERLRLTEEERRAITEAIEAAAFDARLFDCEWAVRNEATLRGLLERTK